LHGFRLCTGTPGGDRRARRRRPFLGYYGPLPTGVTWSGDVNGSVAWSYNSFFQRTAEAVSNGVTTSRVNFNYARDGLVTCASLSTCGGANQRAVPLLLEGRPPTDRQQAWVVTDTLTYNSYGELKEYTAKYSGSQIYRAVYDSTTAPRDNLGRVVEKVETLQGVARTSRYGYDDLGRLVTVTEGGVLTEQYVYDGNGNRRFLITPGATIEGTYDDQDRLVTYGDFTYEYTPNGELARKRNTATDEETTYEYDALGSLIRVVLPDSTEIAYVVDGLGRRVAKRVNGVITKRWLYVTCSARWLSSMAAET